MMQSIIIYISIRHGARRHFGFRISDLVPLAGLEPATQSLGNSCSIQTELQGQYCLHNLFLGVKIFNLIRYL